MITISQIASLEAKVSTALAILKEVDGFVSQAKAVLPTTAVIHDPHLESFLGKLESFFSIVEALGSKIQAPTVNPPPASPVA